MQRLILELRRREVFRTAGLYVGICWIAIEGASIVLPAFDAPEWMLQALIIAAVVGFPIMLVFAWVYDISSKGVEVTPDATETVVIPFGKSKGDMIVIGVLSVALIFSVYLNITRSGRPAVIETPDPVSILIADFQNFTGDPLFDGSLEDTMTFGIEGAPFITAFKRSTALSRAQRIRPDATLDEEGARLVAVREGIRLVLAGAVSEDDGRYEFTINVVDVNSGDDVVDVKRVAASKAEVLGTVSELADQVREGLGDQSFKDESLRGTETFTAASLEAAKTYTLAQNLAYSGDYQAAMDEYRKAVELDPNFGRAYSGWALSAFNLGRNEEAEELWKKALSFMDTMTDRERYRTLGLYYMAVSQNYPKAIESYESLVEKYPADGAGHNNLAVAYFSTLDFERAMQEGQSVLEIYPGNLFYQQNFALYAMYAGNFELAEQRARDVIAADASRYYARLPLAIAELARGDSDAALRTYEDMASTGSPGASLASVGIADIALYKGDYEAAVATLTEAISADREAGNVRATATKLIMLARAHAALGNIGAMRSAIDESLAVRGGLARQVPAALLFIESGDVDSARLIADELTSAVQNQRRAYGQMLSGIIESRAGNHAAALEHFREALGDADLWLIRYHYAAANLAAGMTIEALDEYEIATSRIGEASAAFLDDSPTWHYTAELPYWLGRAQDATGMTAAAKSSYGQFIARRPADDPLVEDARARMTRPAE